MWCMLYVNRGKSRTGGLQVLEEDYGQGSPKNAQWAASELLSVFSFSLCAE